MPGEWGLGVGVAEENVSCIGTGFGSCFLDGCKRQTCRVDHVMQ